MSNSKNLEKSLNGALDEFQQSMIDLCSRIDRGADFTNAQIVKAIANETYKCLADFRTAIVEAVRD